MTNSCGDLFTRWFKLPDDSLEPHRTPVCQLARFTPIITQLDIFVVDQTMPLLQLVLHIPQSMKMIVPKPPVDLLYFLYKVILMSYKQARLLQLPIYKSITPRLRPQIRFHGCIPLHSDWIWLQLLVNYLNVFWVSIQHARTISKRIQTLKLVQRGENVECLKEKNMQTCRHARK